jgi:flagellar protein FlgJ
VIGNDNKALAAPPIYTDLAGLQQLKGTAKLDRNAALKDIARQFESIMLGMMLKSMREANAVFSEGNPLASSEQQFYQDMFDSQLSLSLGQQGGFGIAEALLRQLQGRGEAVPVTAGAVDVTADVAAPVSTNGLSRPAVSLALPPSLPAAPAAADEALADRVHQLFSGAGLVETETETAAAPVAAAVLDGAPATFVNALYPLAEQIAERLGVDSRVLLSQAALETGWGQKVIQKPDGSSSNNFFNIKADRDWSGDVVTVPTLEYRDGVAVREWAAFRAYASPAESFADYARLIAQNPRYQTALARAADPRAYVQALAKAGYATDPHYASKVMAVLDNEHVQQAAPPRGAL